MIYAGIKVESSKGSVSFERENSTRGQKLVICLLYWWDLGSWLSRGLGRREIPILFSHVRNLCFVASSKFNAFCGRL